jgi:phosphopentomutase
MGRAVILVLDSFGIGATADADRFGDVGSDTLGHIASQRAASADGPLRLPNLAKLGLFHAGRDSTGDFPAGVVTDVEITGAYGFAEELSSGKDTPSGHWEIAGVPVLFDWGYFTDKTDTFPPELLDKLVERAKLPGYLGNCHSSGTVIIAELGFSGTFDPPLADEVTVGVELLYVVVEDVGDVEIPAGIDGNPAGNSKLAIPGSPFSPFHDEGTV